METFDAIIKLFVKKFTSRKMWFALAAAGWAYLSGNYEIMSTMVINYLAVQAVDDAAGEIKGLTEDMNFWLEKLLSRKFWIAALGIFLSYRIPDFEIMRNIVIAYLTAEGFSDALPLVKGTDFGALFRRKQALSTAAAAASAASTTGTVSAKPGEEGYVPASKESDNYPVAETQKKTEFSFEPFDEKEWAQAVKERAQSQFNATDIWLQILALPSVAGERTVRFTRNVVSFGSFYMEKAREAFESKFGFSYEERNKSESLSKLKDLCGKVPSSFNTFIATTSQDQSYQTIYDTVKSVSDQFAVVDRAMEKEAAYDDKLQQYSAYTYSQAFWRMGEFEVA